MEGKESRLVLGEIEREDKSSYITVTEGCLWITWPGGGDRIVQATESLSGNFKKLLIQGMAESNRFIVF